MVDQHTTVYRQPLKGNDLVSRVHSAFPIKRPRWESEWFAPVTTLRDEAMQG